MIQIGIVDESPQIWRCTWCDYVNVRQHAGLDHCSACGSETMTMNVGARDLRVRYTRNPKPGYHLRAYTKLDCVAIPGCKTSESHIIADGRTH